MFKKLLISGAAAGLLLVSAGGAFASTEFHFPWFDPQTTANVSISNTGSVSNVVNTSANTGYNGITGGSVSGSSIVTGPANAGAAVTTGLNQNSFDCGCVLGLSGFDNLNFSLGNNGSVSNVINTSANTGYNAIAATGSNNNWWFWHPSTVSGVTGSSITTGAAGASSVIQSVVNLNTFGSH